MAPEERKTSPEPRHCELPDKPGIWLLLGTDTSPGTICNWIPLVVERSLGDELLGNSVSVIRREADKLGIGNFKGRQWYGPIAPVPPDPPAPVATPEPPVPVRVLLLDSDLTATCLPCIGSDGKPAYVGPRDCDRKWVLWNALDVEVLS
jgi:hypothetical protein